MRKYFFLASLILAFSCKSENEETKPKLNDITESVYASVTISPEVSYFPFTSRAGIIEKIMVQEGDTVSQGQILFKISPSQADNRLVDAQIDLAQTKANYQGTENLLKSIQIEIQTQKQKLTLDSINFKRQENLWSQKIGTAIDYDRAKITYQTSTNNYKSLKEKYDQTKINLRNSYQKAINRVNSEQTSLKEYTVKAEFAGMVYNVFKEVGELLSQQEPFAEIGSVGEFKIKMDIDEVDITKINVGDKVVVSLDAYPNDVFEAVISKIFPKKDEATQTFKVESHFIQVPPRLFNGLSGEANIVVSKRKNVLTIPTDYLLPGNVVMTEDGEKEVKLGIKNMEFVEIVAGLDTNTTISKPKK
ncbi:Multidrug efflux pump subunit AcrA (membrane-fusion protein) [Spirosomataceae bacterium TFI 002]|nr:Multidrug efflux pump subunit AcrA (membrane-fusion protein) [Spirosomataceae bacterium TFI 002]